MPTYSTAVLPQQLRLYALPLCEVIVHHTVYGFHLSCTIVFRILETVAPSKDSTYNVGTDAP
jgi:hypothetical protein